MAVISSYTKHGALRPFQIDTSDYDINTPVRGTSVPGLVLIGQSRGLAPAVWSGIYVMGSDLP